MSDRTYTRNELLRLEDFGPNTEVCRTNSNSWRPARNDPALSPLFEDEPTDEGSSSSTGQPGETAGIHYVPRYIRFLALLVDLSVLVIGVVLVGWLISGLIFRPSVFGLAGVILGALYFPLLESNLSTWKTLGKELLGLKLIDTDESRIKFSQALLRYLCFAVPLFLLGVAFDPGLLHTFGTRAVSLVFALIGIGYLVVNVYLFLFNRPTFRFLHDYLSGVWIVPESADVVPSSGFLRSGKYTSLGLTILLGLGLSAGGWFYFWEVKQPPLIDVPEECVLDSSVSYLRETVNPVEFRELLLAGDYDLLEERLHTLRQRYERGRQSDVPLNTALGAFSVIDDETGKRIDEWVIENPESSYALLARAKYNVRRYRVKRRIHDNPDADSEVTSSLRNYRQQALISGRQALNLDPEFPLAYATLLKLSVVNGAVDVSENLIREGLALRPASVLVREVIGVEFPRLAERYGSSGRVDPMISGDNNLNVFCGLPAFRRANDFRQRGNYRTAGKYYRQALRYGAAPWVYRGWARSASLSGDRQNEAKYFSRAFRLKPHRNDLLMEVARVQFERGLFSQALDSLGKALDRETENPEFLRLYARILAAIGKPDHALERIEHARKFAPRWNALDALGSEIRGGS